MPPLWQPQTGILLTRRLGLRPRIVPSGPLLPSGTALPTSGLVAFWDFTEPAPPYVSKLGSYSGSLANGSGTTTVTSTLDGPFGGGALFNGAGDYLTIPAASVGTLNVANAGDAVTVLAWVSRSDLDQGYIAGLWDEANSRRNYGLFLDLPTYGGDDQVCGHISDHGGPTPGYPFNRDYSASARKVGGAGGRYRFVAFTYDGAQAISYLDGLADARPTFTDDHANTYAKNPYAFTAGLNHSGTIADFTVGGNLISGPAMGNFLAGRVGGLAVYSRALTAAEIMDAHQATLAASAPAVVFDWWTTTAGTQIATGFGWKSARGATATDTSSNGALNNFVINQVTSPDGFLYRSGIGDATNTTTEGIGYYPPVSSMGLQASEVASLRLRLNNSLAADVVRLAVQIGSTWYASDTSYSVTGDGRTAADWSTAETKTLTMSLAANVWRALTFVPGTSLALGSVIGTAISDGTVNAVGVYSPSAAGVLRIDDLTITPAPALILSNIPLDDAAAAADALAVTAGVPVADTGTLADALTVTVPVTISDTVGAADTLTMSVAAAMTDAAAGADAVTVKGSVPLADTGTGTDAVTVAAAVVFGDTGAAVDAVTVKANIPLADTATTTDGLAVTAGAPLADTGAVADAFTVAMSVTLADTATAVDSLAVDAFTVPPHVPVTAVITSTPGIATLTGNGTGTAVLQTVALATAVLAAQPAGAAVLTGSGAGTAVLTGNGANTAVLTPAAGTATLHAT